MSNHFTITGNIAKPNKGTGSDGKPVLNLRIADTPRRKNDQGEWEDAGETMWVGAAVWGDDALELAKVLTKGSKVTASGRLTQRTFQGNDGTDRAAFEIKGAVVGVVPRAPREQGDAWGGGQQSRPPAQQARPPAAKQQAAPAQQQGWGGGGDVSYDEPPF